jgi:monoamine oxidase
MEISCAYPADDLDATVMREGGTDFGDFDTHSVEGGNNMLARGLAETIGLERVHLSAPASLVTCAGQQVQVSAGGLAIAADAAVVAVPASVLDAIEFEPQLPDAKVAAQGAVRYGQAAKLFVALREPVAPSATLSVAERFWCYTQLRPDGSPARYVGAFAGTGAALEALGIAGGPRQWVQALTALRPELELEPDVVTLTNWSDDPWVRGAYSAPSASSPIDQAELSRPVGRLAFAGEHTAGDMHATMEGALRSGRRAAREVLDQFGGQPAGSRPS